MTVIRSSAHGASGARYGCRIVVPPHRALTQNFVFAPNPGHAFGCRGQGGGGEDALHRADYI